jgi:hypothetical protein
MYYITHGKNGRETKAYFETLEAAMACASEIQAQTGIIVGIERKESSC